jgi:hypothetical protein
MPNKHDLQPADNQAFPDDIGAFKDYSGTEELCHFMDEQSRRGSHSAVLLTREQLDPAGRQNLMECLGDPMTTWRTIPSEQEQSGNS